MSETSPFDARNRQGDPMIDEVHVTNARRESTPEAVDKLRLTSATMSSPSKSQLLEPSEGTGVSP